MMNVFAGLNHLLAAPCERNCDLNDKKPLQANVVSHYYDDTLLIPHDVYRIFSFPNAASINFLISLLPVIDYNWNKVKIRTYRTHTKNSTCHTLQDRIWSNLTEQLQISWGHPHLSIETQKAMLHNVRQIQTLETNIMITLNPAKASWVISCVQTVYTNTAHQLIEGTVKLNRMQ